MPLFVPIQTNFNGGEISPLLEGRTDVAAYQKSLRKCRNWIPLIQGCLIRRPGFKKVISAKHNDKKAILKKFIFSRTQAYILELGDEYIRFYRNRGQIVDGGSPVEISSPYKEDDLDQLYFIQKNDIMYIFHPKFQTRKLSRTSDTSWSLIQVTWTNAPAFGTNNYPACGCFYGNRLFIAGAPGFPNQINGSVIGDYENFSKEIEEEVTDEASVEYIFNSNEVETIKWIFPLQSGVGVGTISGEWTVRPSAFGEALTPTNVNAVKTSSTGSSGRIQPIQVSNEVFFVERSKKQLHTYAYRYEIDTYSSINVSQYADHLGVDEFTFLTYQKTPNSIMWLGNKEGELLGLTYNPFHEVSAWHKHNTDGKVLSGDCIPAPDGSSDDFWVLVEREIDGVKQVFVEYMASFVDVNTAREDICVVDSALEYNGALTNTFTGLDHLEGKTVKVLADGASVPDVKVESGSITINIEVEKAIIGLPIESVGLLQRIEAGGHEGGQYKTEPLKINNLYLRVWRSFGLKAGSELNELENVDYRNTLDPLGEPVPLRTGDVEVVFPGGYDKQKNLFIYNDTVFPSAILSLTSEVSVGTIG